MHNSSLLNKRLDLYNSGNSLSVRKDKLDWSFAFLHNSTRQQTRWIKRITQMYKTLRKDHSVPEGHFQNWWQANRGGYSTVEPNKNKLQWRMRLGSNMDHQFIFQWCTAYSFLFSQESRFGSKAFYSPSKSFKLLDLVSQTIHCWW